MVYLAITTTTMIMNSENLEDQYRDCRDRASRFRDALITQLETLLEKNALTLAVPLDGRVKTWSSILEKIHRKSMAIERVLDLDDLIGVRIILLFRRDLKTVNDLLLNNFDVISAENAADRLSETQFGYQSQHYIVRFPEEWLKLPSYAQYRELKTEIQLRTAAQHIWAASSHKLQYKHEASVPLPLLRAIHRVSALLETVDLEFDRLLTEREKYVASEVRQDSDKELLNVESLQKITAELLPAENKHEDEEYDELLVDLIHFNYCKESDLRALICNNLNDALREDANEASKYGMNKYFNHVGLTRQSLSFEVGKQKLIDWHKERPEWIKNNILAKDV